MVRVPSPPRGAGASVSSPPPQRLCVAHVLSSLGMGGQERIALDLATGQAALGHDVVVVSLARPPGGPLAEEFRARGIAILHTPKQRRVDPGTLFRLFSLFRKRPVDVVHTHNPQPLIYASPAARAAGASLVHTKHGMNLASARQMRVRRLSASLADAFIAVSDHTAAVALDARECSQARLHVIPNGIDLSRFGPAPAARAAIRAELGVPRPAHLVGTVGRLSAEKAHRAFLRTVEPLLSEDFHVAIAGDGPEAGALAELARSLSRPASLHLLGPRQDVPNLLAAFDSFALCSAREGLPLVLPEAMACALPVVSTAVGGIPRVVEDGDTGYLVEPGDEAGFRRRLAELAALPELARRLGTRGRERALAEFSAEAMLDRYMHIYRTALRESARWRPAGGRARRAARAS